MRVLGVDPSKTATGWSVYDGRDLVASGTIRSDGALDFAEKFNALLGEWKPGVIAHETAIRSIRMYGRKGLAQTNEGWAGPNAGQLVLLEIQGAIIGLSRALGIHLLPVAASTWRSSILGDGKLARDVAKQRAKETCKRLDLKFKSVDEAEAILIGLWATQTMEVKYWGRAQ